MNRRLYGYDSRVKWLRPMLDAALARGWDARPFGRYDRLDRLEPGYAAIHVHADPGELPADRRLAHAIAGRGVRMVTDLGQVNVYENKRLQVRRWGRLMPGTVIHEDRDQALAFVTRLLRLPIVSKADVGASSYNVRVISDRDALRRYVEAAFTAPGIPVKCCAGEQTQAYQHGYVILQEHVPHDRTYRVNRVGDQFAVFHRFNHPTRGTAQTGNVAPVEVVDDETADLLEWSLRVTDGDVRSKFVALDVLRHPKRGWRLLETSLRWPHPGARDCDARARWFRRVRGDEAMTSAPGGWVAGRPFGEQWEVLMDELEAGAFDAAG